MIEIKADQIERAQALLRHIPRAVPKALANAINRAAQGGRTDAVKKAREIYVIPAGRVRETIEISKAQPSKLSAMVLARGRPRALSYFKITPSKPTKRKPKGGVNAQVKRGAGGRIAKSFVAKMASGHVGVFNRQGASRFPIVQRYGPSVPQMIGSSTVTRFVEEGARRRLSERLDHEINRILRGYGK